MVATMIIAMIAAMIITMIAVIAERSDNNSDSRA